MKITKTLFIAATVATIAACSSNENACEDVNVQHQQIQHCQSLQRQIDNAKDQPLRRTELERRFEQDCVDIRFYRDDKQPAICENKEEAKAFVEKQKQEKK
ncbi:hypothetical protein [Thalassotalea agarivorans]|uniref:Entry exclusion lipoprotein TrbK n=1 Tax=Thalassotalea agarivorans TaxID=349064 RepID=A0A1H9YAI1_THASX|nr:hypothetical protein [Thalassotalea agarivorans]SES65808.1 hypothetical protein SAMN05660429_00142 [Thalassotalea agarivorans]